MTLMSVLGFEASDLEANQRGHLGNRQQQMLTYRLDPDTAEASFPMKVERVTGFVAVDSYHSSGKRGGDIQLWFGDRPVVMLECAADASEVSRVFEPERIYTAYYVECDGHRLLLSVEEGPDWQGGSN